MTRASAMKRVLLVEDSQSNALVYQQYIQELYYVDIAYSGLEALSKIDENEFDLIILDLHLPDIGGLELLKNIKARSKDTPVIIITAHGSMDVAMSAMRAGAEDFISKPFDKTRLQVTTSKLIKQHKLESVLQEYERTCQRESYQNMIGGSLPMQSVYNIIDNSAMSKASVFITGESGTGKELCAEAIHKVSQRANEPMVTINCAAIPEDLLESELFGHVKGAFTGAASNREGAAARAHKGTLFLDEIGEMPLSLQSKLLRFIQTGRFTPVGSNKEYSVDIRFVCATNRNPEEEVKNKRFREDLYYRLHVIPIQLPPLRERGDDILKIANFLLKQYVKEEGKRFYGFSNDSIKVIMDYHWPGNVRELSNVIRNIVVLNDSEIVTPDMFSIESSPLENSGRGSEAMRQQRSGSQSEEPSMSHSSGTKVLHSVNEIKPLWIIEKEYIELVIEQCNGNIPKAAARLEVSPSTIYRKKSSWEKAAS